MVDVLVYVSVTIEADFREESGNLLIFYRKEDDMRRISRSIAAWFSIQSEQGVTAIEYGLIASLIAVVIIVGVAAVGTNLEGLFNYIANKVVAP